jgi:hypothetical protein
MWNRWKNYFLQLLDSHGVSDVMQMEMHIAVPLVPESNASDIDIFYGKVEKV